MPASFEISAHAVQRWIERVQPGLTPAQARAAIRSHSHAIETAMAFGCSIVRLEGRKRLLVDPKTRMVVTVTPRTTHYKGTMHNNGGEDHVDG